MSSKRLSPKEIKRDIREDELRSLLTETLIQAQLHWRWIVAGMAGVVVLILAGVGIYAYFQSLETEANAELAEAIEVYSAPVVEEDADPDDPKAPTFPSGEARRERSREAFTAIRDKTGAGIAGDVAELYLAEISLAEGDAETAREIWEDFLDDHEDHVLAISVRINLIHLDRDEDKAEEVVARLEEALENPESTLPEDVVLFELGTTLEELGRSDEAREHYQRLVDEYPRSAYLTEVNQRLASLG